MSENESPGAWRKVRVPDYLVRGAVKDIKKWAREKLSGQEADLKADDLTAIRQGTKKEILLRPKKPGFFLPTGEFVEALGTIKLSDDIDNADRHIEEIEQDYAWADEENERFRQPNGNSVRALWEHGQRIAAYVKASGRSLYTIHRVLEARGGEGAYRLHTHQTSSRIFEWRPSAAPDDTIFRWSWELVDAVLNFAKENEVRDRTQAIIDDVLVPRGVQPRVITAFLRGRKDKRGVHLWGRAENERLEEFRTMLKGGGSIQPVELEELASLLGEKE